MACSCDTLFIIYIILGILYESFIHPITILTGCRSRVRALFALYVTHVELGVYGYVGIIMPIGIVERTRSAMIDFALARQRRNTFRRRPRSSRRRASGSVRS
jgi:HAE1 family hydrophobic/amphiphilic exporter-1